MRLSILPTGDGITILLPKEVTSSLNDCRILSIGTEEGGLSFTFDAFGGPLAMQIPFSVAEFLSETDGQIYIYGKDEENVVAEFFSQTVVEKGPLFKAIGAWEALFGGSCE